MAQPQYYELVDALVGMACQYLRGLDGKLDDDCVSAGEIAIDTLNQLGLIKDGDIISEAFDYEWLKREFADSPK